MTHYVKSHPEPFQAAWDRRKPADLRPDDRDPPFAVGDLLYQREWDPATEAYSGRGILAEITDIRREERWGLRPGYAMLGLGPIRRYLVFREVEA